REDESLSMNRSAGVRLIRALTRSVLLIAAALVLLATRWILSALCLRREGIDRALRRHLLRAWARFFAWVAGIRVQVHGTPPKPPFFLVANHLSYMDMLVLNLLTGCLFVSRGDVKDWPIIGPIARSLHIVFVDRLKIRDTRRANQEIAETLRKGDGIAVFPEGRISVGLAVAPFKSSLIEPAVALEVPIHCAALTYETLDGMPPAGQVVSWWRPEPFFYHLFRLLGYPGLKVTVRFASDSLCGEDRKDLAFRLHAMVSRMYETPITEPVPAIARQPVTQAER
ncbi:MAG TPA: lysophospholipid acyltransferase family protein, partial [Candidatus Hydrogenedentes bacterium]|nr:lysophospholipid acyltransferase family protein [Candidatus Hydrogenedentota bacterium]